MNRTLLVGALLPLALSTLALSNALAVGPTPSQAQAGGTQVDSAQWARILPGYVAFAATPGAAGSLVLAGQEYDVACEEPGLLSDEQFDRCVRQITRSQDCAATACGILAWDGLGGVWPLADDLPTSTDSGQGYLAVASDVRAGGHRVVAVASNDTAGSVRVIDGGTVSRTSIEGPALSVAVDRRGTFWLTSGKELLTLRDGRWVSAARFPCAVYDVSARGRPFVTGFGGTYRVTGTGRVRRVGPGGEEIWRRGRDLAVAVPTADGRDARIWWSSDGGDTWSPEEFSRDDDGARFIVADIDSNSSGVWAVGGRRDEPGSRLWHRNGGSWERVAAPDLTHYFSDLVVGDDDHLTLVSLDGLYRAS